jgi:hypothetical protein
MNEFLWEGFTVTPRPGEFRLESIERQANERLVAALNPTTESERATVESIIELSRYHREHLG